MTANPFIWFAVLCAIGLASAITSFTLRKRLGRRNAPQKRGFSFIQLMLFLGCAEGPAFLGLVYFLVFRDWPGFLLLLIPALASFILHAQRAPAPPDGDGGPMRT